MPVTMIELKPKNQLQAPWSTARVAPEPSNWPEQEQQRMKT